MIRLRDYQLKAVEAVFREWENVRSTLYVAATGTGKTSIFTEIIARTQPKRTIVVAHREELIFQAVRRIEDQVGLTCEMEMADLKASTSEFMRPDVVVATVQTLISGTRMSKFNPQDFGLLVIDEGHHVVASSYRRIIEHFSQNPELKIVGCTATPDRADEEALGQIFETVADVYEILDAIHDGWLVPVDQQMVYVEGLDFSTIRTTAGDLNNTDLASVMEKEKNLYGVCGSTLELIGDKQTIVFTASVRHAEMACEIFNRHRSGMAEWICGKTDKQVRRGIMTCFAKGKTQILCNVGCLTEGVDIPNAEIVVMARPTKSRSLYAQMAGRILRPLPGIVDPMPTKDQRKWAIFSSAKPSALLIDFVGNSGRHKLITAVDILGGNASDRAIEVATQKIKDSPGQALRVSQILDEAEEEIRREEEERRKQEQARRARLVAKVRYSTKKIDPFDAFDLMPARERGWDKDKVLSPKQRMLLLRQGVDGDSMPYVQARQILNTMFYRWKNNLASMKQCAVLKRYGYNTSDMTRSEASSLLDQLSKNNWRALATH